MNRNNGYAQGPNKAYEDSSIPVTIQFHGWLVQLVRRCKRHSESIIPALAQGTSVKNLIESFGVPHTEVAAIEVNRQLVTFDHIIVEESTVEIFPLCPPVDVHTPTLLRPVALPAIRFLVDVNVGKLARKLRMTGFDTLFNMDWCDTDLAKVSEQEQCILVTRDIMLLKRKNVIFGHFVRETMPVKQLSELIHFYGLSDKINPFSRCIRCNGLLKSIDKEEIQDLLEPLTRKYYETFHRCNSCSHLYWAGSHRNAMQKNLAEMHKYHPLSY